MTDAQQVNSVYTLEDAIYDAAVSGDEGVTISYDHEGGLWNASFDGFHGSSHPDLKGALMDALAKSVALRGSA